MRNKIGIQRVTDVKVLAWFWLCHILQTSIRCSCECPTIVGFGWGINIMVHHFWTTTENKWNGAIGWKVNPVIHGSQTPKIVLKFIPNGRVVLLNISGMTLLVVWPRNLCACHLRKMKLLLITNTLHLYPSYIIWLSTPFDNKLNNGATYFHIFCSIESNNDGHESTVATAVDDY